MGKLSIRSSDYDNLVASGARTLTVRNKRWFSGSCGTSVVATGGSVPAGTYYYKICPIVGGEELLTPSQSAATTTTGATSIIHLSWDAVTGSSSYKVYRDTNFNFTSTSCYLGTTGSNNFYDNSGSTFAGAPTGSMDQGGSWGDSILNADEISEEWAVFDKNPKDIALDEGFRFEDYRYGYAPSTTKVKYNDIVNFDSTDFIVTGVTSIVVGDQRVAVKVGLRRLAAQTLNAQSD